MQIVRLAEARPYDASKHVDVRSWRLQGAETSPAFCRVGLSRYAPSGRAELDAGAEPKIYVVLGGELTITRADGTTAKLRAFDSCLIPAYEQRQVDNLSGAEAVLLVIMP